MTRQPDVRTHPHPIGIRTPRYEDAPEKENNHE